MGNHVRGELPPHPSTTTKVGSSVNSLSKQLDDLRAEYRTLLNSWEYAFAMGHGCSVGPRPEGAEVLRRAADLKARIAELEQS